MKTNKQKKSTKVLVLEAVAAFWFKIALLACLTGNLRISHCVHEQHVALIFLSIYVSIQIFMCIKVEKKFKLVSFGTGGHFLEILNSAQLIFRHECTKKLIQYRWRGLSHSNCLVKYNAKKRDWFPSIKTQIVCIFCWLWGPRSMHTRDFHLLSRIISCLAFCKLK